MGGHVTCMGDRINAYTILAGKPKGKRPLRRTDSRCKYDTKMDFNFMGCIMVCGK
jgi:hypothetical protein